MAEESILEQMVGRDIPIEVTDPETQELKPEDFPEVRVTPNGGDAYKVEWKPEQIMREEKRPDGQTIGIVAWVRYNRRRVCKVEPMERYITRKSEHLKNDADPDHEEVLPDRNRAKMREEIDLQRMCIKAIRLFEKEQAN